MSSERNSEDKNLNPIIFYQQCKTFEQCVYRLATVHSATVQKSLWFMVYVDEVFCSGVLAYFQQNHKKQMTVGHDSLGDTSSFLSTEVGIDTCI
jgi:hypothetical protein